MAVIFIVAITTLSVGTANTVMAQAADLDVTYNYTWKYSADGFKNITGGPPLYVNYNETFPVNITLEAYSCSNTDVSVNTVTNLDNHQSQSGGGQVANEEGGNTKYYTECNDIWLGNFNAPTKTDVKINATTYQHDPTCNVNTILTLRWSYWGSKDISTVNGNWTVNLISPVHQVPIAVKVTPKGGYQYWINSASATKTINVQ